jgi:hypothetical protein
MLNYGRIRLAGSFVLGAFFAALPTYLAWDSSGRKPERLLLFIPLLAAFSVALIWVNARQAKANAETARARFEKGEQPLGR